MTLYKVKVSAVWKGGEKLSITQFVNAEDPVAAANEGRGITLDQLKKVGYPLVKSVSVEEVGS